MPTKLSREEVLEMANKLMDIAEQEQPGATGFDFTAMGISSDRSESVHSGASGNTGALMHFGLSTFLFALEQAEENQSPREKLATVTRLVLSFLHEQDPNFMKSLVDDENDVSGVVAIHAQIGGGDEKVSVDVSKFVNSSSTKQ